MLLTLCGSGLSSYSADRQHMRRRFELIPSTTCRTSGFWTPGSKIGAKIIRIFTDIVPISCRNPACHRTVSAAARSNGWKRGLPPDSAHPCHQFKFHCGVTKYRDQDRSKRHVLGFHSTTVFDMSVFRSRKRTRNDGKFDPHVTRGMQGASGVGQCHRAIKSRRRMPRPTFTLCDGNQKNRIELWPVSSVGNPRCVSQSHAAPPDHEVVANADLGVVHSGPTGPSATRRTVPKIMEFHVVGNTAVISRHQD